MLAIFQFRGRWGCLVPHHSRGVIARTKTFTNAHSGAFQTAQCHQRWASTGPRFKKVLETLCKPEDLVFSLRPELPRLRPRDAAARSKALQESNKLTTPLLDPNSHASFLPLSQYIPSRIAVPLREADIDRFVAREHSREEKKKPESTPPKPPVQLEKQRHSALKQTMLIMRELQKQRNAEDYAYRPTWVPLESPGKQLSSVTSETLAAEPVLKDLCVSEDKEVNKADDRLRLRLWTRDPYRVRWELYCALRSTWDKTLAAHFQCLRGLGTKLDRCVQWVWIGMIALYGVQALSCTIYYKFSVILRYQALFTASALAYNAGILWGYSVGMNGRHTKQGAQLCARLACWMLGTGLAGVTCVAFDPYICYTALHAACTTSILGLVWCNHCIQLPKWMLSSAIAVFASCVVANIVGQLQAKRLQQSAHQALLEADLSDKLSITSLVKAYAPQSLVHTLFHEPNEP